MKRLRCAIYTRKSTDEGLDQAFNSLDAQREACAAYIVSQAGEGWTAVNARYDDGGFSGGNMERSGLKRLLADVAAGKVNVVVTYKVDRLTRSLTDFARLVDLFDKHEVSFVSVTQQFNTTTSMGRLTLNVLLSFAQFEREVTAERIRDKIAASKQKGMWMGGVAPLGYDVDDKALIVNPGEAATIRTLFRLYAGLGSVAEVQKEADRLGLRTKARGPNNGARPGNAPFTRGHLYKLLQNPTYVGEVRHKGQIHLGTHDAIIDQETWDTVQQKFERHAVTREQAANTASRHLLKGRLYDPHARLMSPTHAKKGDRRYRYYVSRISDTEVQPGDDIWRLPAPVIEDTVISALATFLKNQRRLMRKLGLDGITPRQLQATITAAAGLAERLIQYTEATQSRPDINWIQRVQIGTDSLSISLDRQLLLETLGVTDAASTVVSESSSAEIIAPVQLRRRGVEAKLLLVDDADKPRPPDQTLIALLAQSHRWADELKSGVANSVKELAERYGADKGDVSRVLPLTYLAPDVVTAILEGRQPVELTASRLKRIGNLPPNWVDQRRLLGFV